MRVPSGKRVRATRMADVPIGAARMADVPIGAARMADVPISNADWMEAGA